MWVKNDYKTLAHCKFCNNTNESRWLIYIMKFSKTQEYLYLININMKYLHDTLSNKCKLKYYLYKNVSGFFRKI